MENNGKEQKRHPVRGQKTIYSVLITDFLRSIFWNFISTAFVSVLEMQVQSYFCEIVFLV
jgi:hypothetical protein